MKESSNCKSIGPASIPSKFLKSFQTALGKPVSLIANLSFSTGSFPDNWTIANLTPIFKKDDRTICNNYRPISLLSNISKTIKKLIHDRLKRFLNKHNILYERQFVFRHNHSTIHALLEISEKKWARLRFRQVCLPDIPWLIKGFWYCKSRYTA